MELTVRLAMSPPVSPLNQDSEGGGEARVLGNATTPRPLTSCAHMQTHAPGAARGGGGLADRGVAIWLRAPRRSVHHRLAAPLCARRVVTRFVYCPATAPSAVAFATHPACTTSLDGCGTPQRAPVPFVCSHRAAKVSP